MTPPRLVRQLLFAAVVFLACRAEQGRGPPPTTTSPPGDTTLARADSFYLEGELDSARLIWRSAISAAATRNDSATIAILLTSLGLAARKEAQYDEARDLLERSLALKQRLGLRRELFRSYNGLGILAENEGRLNDATTFYEQATQAALENSDSLSAAKAANNQGLVYGRLGDFERSRVGFAMLRDVARAKNDSVSLGRALNNLAQLEWARGDPLAALAQLEEVRSLARSTRDVELEENALGQMALAYDALGDPPRAFAALDSALELTRRHGMRRQEGEDLRILGDLYVDAGDYQRALTLYGGAQTLLAELELPEETGDVLLSIAEAQLELGRVDLANQRAFEALRMHRAGGYRLAEFGDLVSLAELSQAAGRPADAQRYLRSAGVLAGVLRTEMAAAEVALAEARVADRAGDWRRVLNVLDGARAPLALTGNAARAEAHAMRARAYSRLNQLEASVAAGRQALDNVERVRGTYSSGPLRTSYVSSKASVYAEQVMALLRLGRTAEAFEVADAGRGRALVERLTVARGDVRRSPGAAGSLIEAETLLRRIDSLVARIRELEQVRPPRERGPVSVDERSLNAELTTAQSQYEALLVRTSETDAVGAAVLGSSRTREASVRASLDADEALFEYFVLPDRLLVFVVTSDTVRSVTSAIGADELVARVRLARELVGHRQSTAAQSEAVLTALHTRLVRPALEAIDTSRVKRLLIVPHGTLSYLPFAALRDSSTGQYLIARYSLLQLPTASALPALRSGARPPLPTARRHYALAPLAEALPASRVEVERVRRSVRGTEPIVGARATEAVLRVALSHGGIVHVATHGVMNARNPMFSRIELAPRDRLGPGDDGRLEVHEVLGLSISSPLVFLSGCETGLGSAWSTSFDRGEDYATLAQAFLYAGARNVVATLWRVADESSADFAAHFYAALPSLGAADALAQAQRRMLADPRYEAPYYWASYQVSGSGKSITASRP